MAEIAEMALQSEGNKISFISFISAGQFYSRAARVCFPQKEQKWQKGLRIGRIREFPLFLQQAKRQAEDCVRIKIGEGRVGIFIEKPERISRRIPAQT